MKKKVMSNLRLDTRKSKKDGTFPVKIFFTINRHVYRLGTGVSCTKEDWLKICSKKNFKDFKKEKDSLLIQKQKVDKILEELQDKGDLFFLKPQKIIDYITKKTNPYENELEHAFEEMIESKDNLKTKKSYIDSFRLLRRFYDISNFKFVDIDTAFLIDLDKKMSLTRNLNSRGDVFKNIKAVLNYSIKLGELNPNFRPFDDFHIKKGETNFRYLNYVELRILKNMDLDDQQRKYVDIFFLSFYLLGINMIDLLYLKRENFHGDRIEFIRSKTKKKFSIKVEPEAMAIIDKYAGVKFLINVMDRYNNHEYFIRNMNDTLQLIGTKHKNGMRRTGNPMFPHLTSYWARYSWATLAADMDINESIIASALGHRISNRVTSIYIRPNLRKVDVANRKLIDFLNSDEMIEY